MEIILKVKQHFCNHDYKNVDSHVLPVRAFDDPRLFMSKEFKCAKCGKLHKQANIYSEE